MRAVKSPLPLLLLLASLLLTVLSVRQVRAGEATAMDAAVQTCLSPLQASMTGLGSTWARLTGMGAYVEENQRLRATVQQLEMERQQLQVSADENARLTALLRLRRHVAAATIAARILARSPTQWLSSVTLDQGEADGVTSGMVVAADGGLVGQVVSTDAHTARVRLVTGTATVIPAYVKRGHVAGFVYGDGSATCEMRYIPVDAQIQENDVVISSGAGADSPYPAGLVVGNVVSVQATRDSLYKTARVKPRANLGALSEVLLVGNPRR